jgi:FMN phosphatase YigB (HAD superfamily)
VAVKAVVFDVGETLVDETRYWGEWADRAGVPRLTFFAVLGGVIERGEDHRRVFELVRPDFDVDRALREGGGNGFRPSDLYDDALPCIEQLRARGYRVGLAGNQTEETARTLESLGVPADFAGSSAEWGVWKPSPLFFARVAEEAGCPPSEIAYVGDRVDNDVVPAATAGMVAVFLRRGPWALLHAHRPEASVARLTIDSLDELPEALTRV